MWIRGGVRHLSTKCGLFADFFLEPFPKGFSSWRVCDCFKVHMQLFCASNLSDLFVISAGMHMSRDLVSPVWGIFFFINSWSKNCEYYKYS